MKDKNKRKIKKIVNKLFDKLENLVIAETFISEDNWDRFDVSSLLEPEISKKEE